MKWAEKGRGGGKEGLGQSIIDKAGGGVRGAWPRNIVLGAMICCPPSHFRFLPLVHVV